MDDSHSIEQTRSREERDVELFDKIVLQYGRKDSLPASRAARRQRLLQSLSIADLGKGPRVLELGCGAGWSVPYLEGMYSSYVGIDYSESLINLASELHDQDNVEFRVGNIKHLDVEEGFDVAFMIGVLHHIDDIPAALERSVSALKPGGWLIANEPQSGNPLVQFARRVRKWCDSGYSEDQITLGRGQLQRCFEQAGLEEVRIFPQGYFSTPFAEVCLPLQQVTAPLAAAACATDRTLEAILPRRVPLSWNLVACGRKG